MTMHTIKSYFGKTLDVTHRRDGIYLACQNGDTPGDVGHLRIYKRDELFAALGIDELGCGCDEADDNLKAAITEDAEAFGAAAVTRAEEAEAEALEQAKLVRTWADRAEKAEGDAREWKARAERWAESKESWKADAAEWRARAEKAEAKVARVWGIVTLMIGPTAHKLRAALADDEPAFTLPTEAGAGIKGTYGEDHPGDEREFRLFSDGQWYCNYGSKWSPEEILRDVSNLRLLGADQ